MGVLERACESVGRRLAGFYQGYFSEKGRRKRVGEWCPDSLLAVYPSSSFPSLSPMFARQI